MGSKTGRETKRQKTTTRGAAAKLGPRAKNARAAARVATRKLARTAAGGPARQGARATRQEAKPSPPPQESPYVELLDSDSSLHDPAAYRLSRAERRELRQMLEARREEVICNAQRTLGEGIRLDAAELPDDMDLASSEYLQYFNLRLRGREKAYLEKIERALSRIDDDNFGLCDECGEPIGIERLRVRPEATLCIRCKEAQEREEQQFA